MVSDSPIRSGERSRIAQAWLVKAAVAAALASSLPAAYAQDASADGVEEVVVTGSRITRRDNTADSPIVTVGSDALQSTSEIGVEQALNKMPQFVPGQNQFSDATSITVTPRQSPGIATANLRGLGANRTLVLLDGRRTQPANASMVVDLNTIPSAAIDNVEVITGGAGSTYGADAVAGVVNFKLKRNYQGVTVDVQTGMTERGDGHQRSASALLGSNFDEGRGNAMIGLSFSKRDTIIREDVPFYAATLSDPYGSASQFLNFPGIIPGAPGNIGNGAAGGAPSQAGVNAYFAGRYGYPNGEVAAGSLYINRAPTLEQASLFALPQGRVTGQLSPGYSGPLYPDTKYVTTNVNTRARQLTTNNSGGYLQVPLTRYSLFANSHYELNEHAEVYMQASFDENRTETATGDWTPAGSQWGVTVPFDAAHPVPTDVAALLRTRAQPTAAWNLNQNMTFMPKRQLDTTLQTYELLAGVRGTIGFRDWTYDVFASRGNTTQNVAYEGFADAAAYQALINMPNYGANADYNNGRLGLLAHCTSGLNPFLSTPVTQDCIDILDSNAKLYQSLEQMQAELNVQGSLFEVPAGDLRFAVGAGYRKNQYAYLPDHGMQTTNIVSVVQGQFDTTETHGEIAVKEIFAEVLAPIVRDVPFVQKLELNAGYRYSDYDTNAGGVSTWKLTANWDVNDFVKIRGGRQVANRAPNIAELFQPAVFEVATWTDHDPCSVVTRATYGNVATNPNRAKVQQLCTTLSGGFPVTSTFTGNQAVYFPAGRDLTSGNPDLDSEKAKTWTAGVVLRSPFEAESLRRATLSVDWYSINVEGAIATATTSYVYQVCFNAFGTNPNYDPANPFCQRIIRDPSNGFWVATRAQFLNLSKRKTDGIDAVFDYRIDTPFLFGQTGTVNLNVNANWLLGYDVQVAPNLPSDDYKDSINSQYGAQYRWKMQTNLGYSVGPATVTLGWRHLPKVRNANLVTNPGSTTRYTSSYELFNLNGRWMINDTLSVRGGVDNLFDREPVRVGVNYVPTAAGTGYTEAVGVTDSSNYDIAGRRYYLGLTAKF